MTPPGGGRGTSSPATYRSYLPSIQGAPSDLSGHKVIVVFNPAARDGRIGQELPQLRQILEGHGARVIPIETLPDQGARRDRIQNSIAQVLAETPRTMVRASPVQPSLPKILILPYGGDGTIWETVGEALRGAEISLEPGNHSGDLTASIRSQIAFILAKKGTASDNAVQMGAPSRARSLPKFITRSVELPYWFPIIETPSSQGPKYEVAGHSYSLGVGGYLFTRRESRRAENPKGFWNQGLRSYLALIPSATLNRYGWLGVDVDLTHFDALGREKHSALLRGSEVIVSPNRIIAGVGGVPGGWGDTKLVILPPGPRGVLALGEFIFRGLSTKLGWNLVGPQNRLRTLRAERQIRILPGERVEVTTRVPDNFSWDILRLGQQTFNGSRTAQGIYKWLGFGQLGEPIPAAGEALTVPAQRNGDVVTPQSQFTVRSSNFAISFLAHPNSLGVHLARSSALADKSVPLVSDQQLVAHVIGENEPRVLIPSEGHIRARTPFISQPRFHELMGRGEYGLPMEFAPELMMAQRGITESSELSRFAHRDLNLENLHRFLGSDAGQSWINAYRSPGTALGRRVLIQGVPLGLGVGALFGAEEVSDALGLHPVADRELRFGMAVYAAHAVQANAAPLWEVMGNRYIFNRPFDYMRTRSARVAGEVLHQYEFFRHASAGEALSGSWRTGAMALGASESLFSRALRFSAIPLRAAWNMGHGLMFSRVTESLVQDLPEDSWLRNYGPTLAFFAPDVSSILAPRSTQLLIRNRPMGLAGRVFAGAFIADMAFTGATRISQGDEALRERGVDYQAAELRRQRGDSSLWRDTVRFLAPGISSHIDSHEYLFGSDNQYRREVLSQGRRLGSQLQQELQEEIPQLLRYLHLDWESGLGTRLELSELEQEMMDQLSVYPHEAVTTSRRSSPDPVAWIRAEFSGHDLTEPQVERALARIRLHAFQLSLGNLMNLGDLGSRPLAAYFDQQGRLLPGQGVRLEEHLAQRAGKPLPFLTSS